MQRRGLMQRMTERPMLRRRYTQPLYQ